MRDEFDLVGREDTMVTLSPKHSFVGSTREDRGVIKLCYVSRDSTPSKLSIALELNN